MLSEKYLRKRFRDGRNIGHGEGREEGRGEGRVEGVHIGAQAVLDWVKRRDAAIAAGIPFG